MNSTLEQYAIPMVLNDIRKEVLDIFADKEKRSALIKEVEETKGDDGFTDLDEIKREIVFHLFWLMRELFTASLERMTASITKH